MKRRIKSIESNPKKKRKKSFPKAKKPLCPVPLSDIKEYTKTFKAADVTQWKEELNKTGFVVIEDAISLEDVRMMIKLWEKDLSLLGTGIDLSNPNTLVNGAFPSMTPTFGIFKYCWGHARSAWESRRLTKHIFSSYFNTQDLQCSFDGASMFRNWGLKELKKSKTKGLWPHVDQGRGEVGDYIQGMLCLKDANMKTGGFVASPGSHKFHSDIIDEIKGNSNFMVCDFSKPNNCKIVKECGLRMVSAPAGGVILWDSKTIHSNVHALEPPDSKETVLRMNNYVCFMPSRYDTLTLDARKYMVDNSKQGNHWTFKTLKNGPMKIEYPSYPRHSSFQTLNSVSIPPETVYKEYSDILGPMSLK